MQVEDGENLVVKEEPHLKEPSRDDRTRKKLNVRGTCFPDQRHQTACSSGATGGVEDMKVGDVIQYVQRNVVLISMKLLDKNDRGIGDSFVKELQLSRTFDMMGSQKASCIP